MIEIYRDRTDFYNFRIRAKNNHVIASSEGAYVGKKGCINGIRSMLENIGMSDSKIERTIRNIKEIEGRE